MQVLMKLKHIFQDEVYKKIDIKLVSLESIFHHGSNNAAYVLYDRDIVVLFIWSRFTLKCGKIN
jgi:hypothetical protein